jgi:hypothetical protein
MKITNNNVAPKRPANEFFDSSDSFARFGYQLSAAREALRKARLYCIPDTDLYMVLQEAINQLDTLEIEY